MNTRQTKVATATAAVVGLLLLSGTVSAAQVYDWDRKSYTGAQCQPVYGIHSSHFTIYQGRLRNDSDGNRWVSCAITFDAEDTLDSTDGYDTATADGGFNLRVYLDYSGVPAGPSFTTNCTLAGRLPNGTSYLQTLGVTSTKTATTQNIYFSGVPLDGLSIGSNGVIQLSCLLPTQVGLSAIKVYENGRTDINYYTP